MTWWAWVLLVPYLVVYVWTWRRAAWIIADYWAIGAHAPDGSDLALGIFIGFIVSCAWPAVIPIYWANQHGDVVATMERFVRRPAPRREAER